MWGNTIQPIRIRKKTPTPPPPLLKRPHAASMHTREWAKSPNFRFATKGLDVRQPAGGGEGEAGAHRAPEWHRVPDWPAKGWPAHREARGKLALKGSPGARRPVHAECTVQHGVLTLSVAKRNASGESSSSVVAEVPVKDLAVGLQRAQTSMITLATLYEGKVYDEIYCFADNQSERNQWIAVFRRMGVPIFDVSPEKC